MTKKVQTLKFALLDRIEKEKRKIFQKFSKRKYP